MAKKVHLKDILKKSQNDIPLGVTCHYERIENKWYVVWCADFPGDNPGRKLMSENAAFLLECGYQIGKNEVVNSVHSVCKGNRLPRYFSNKENTWNIRYPKKVRR